LIGAKARVVPRQDGALPFGRAHFVLYIYTFVYTGRGVGGGRG